MLTDRDNQLEAQIRDAVRLHGHLGPFLVIGVRIGVTVKQMLKLENQPTTYLHAHIQVPLRTPFSCTLDGIQSTTHCTIGNRRLRVTKSQQEMKAQFEIADSDKTLTITVNPKIIKEITDRISKGTPNEVLAEEIASMPEQQLLKSDLTGRHR
jgi:formylmethanofuran dehydrogenase subunit E